MEKCWLAVDNNGSEYIYDYLPSYRSNVLNSWKVDEDTQYIELPKGSIFKLIGKELTWNDEPYLYK